MQARGTQQVREVELVLVRSDEADRYGAEILGYLTVAEEDCERRLDRLNAAALQRGFTWRVARSFPDQGHYCPSCGASQCWCGIRRLTHRSQAAR